MADELSDTFDVWLCALGVCVESGSPGVVVLNHMSATISGNVGWRDGLTRWVPAFVTIREQMTYLCVRILSVANN